MKEFGRQSKQTLANINNFFGEEYKESIDQVKYATILNNVEYPDFLDDPESAVNNAIAAAQKELDAKYPPFKGNFFRRGLVIKQLGKPKGYQSYESQEALEKLSGRMGQVLAGYEEELDLSVSFERTESDSMELQLRIAEQSGNEESLAALIRGVYSQAEIQPFSDVPVKYSERLYASLTIPYWEKGQEKDNAGRNVTSNWIDAVLSSLPESDGYRVTIKIVPLNDDNLVWLKKRIFALQHQKDILTLYSESDWGKSTNIGASYNREKSTLADVKDQVKKLATSLHRATGNFGETFSLTRHQKNARAEQLLRQIDQKLYILNKTLQMKAWQLVVSVEADDEHTIQTVCVSMNGALRQENYILDWQKDSCTCALLSSEELAPFLKFPTKEFIGFEFIENEEFSLASPANEENGMKIGSLLWNKTEASPFYLSEDALNRHAFICGMTGAGKTNTLFKLLEAVNVPFLVIEPVKGEYRALASKYDDLKIYSMKTSFPQGDHVSMIQINPFWFPEHTNIAFHIDSIKTIIASAFEMSNAMPNILEQCMYNIYIKAGWNIITGKNQFSGTIPDEFLYPTFQDLLDEVEDYLDHSKFVGETLGDYHGAMTTRLKSFVNSYKGLLLNTVKYPDYEQIMKGRSVIELEGLADDADKCLVMGTILVQYFEYLKLHFSVKEKSLQHLVVIEEAHRLFKNGGKASSAPREGTGADPTGQLVESLSNIMAEIRAFGEGMLIVDQSPSKVAEDVIKNSSTKIIHRVDNDKDINLLQAALLIPDDKTSLPSLGRGQALIRTDGMRRPCKVKIDHSNIKDDYQLSCSFRKTTAEVTENSLGYSFAAMATLSDDSIAEFIRTSIWCMLMEFYMKGLDNWKICMDEFVVSVISHLKLKRKYHLVDSNFSVIRHLVSQSVRQLRAHSNISIGINEIGCVHLFIQRLFDFYEEVCDGISVKDGNINLFAEYFSNNIAPLTYEYAEAVKSQKHSVKTK